MGIEPQEYNTTCAIFSGIGKEIIDRDVFYFLALESWSPAVVRFLLVTYQSHTRAEAMSKTSGAVSNTVNVYIRLQAFSEGT